jgi:hypothetical protein
MRSIVGILLLLVGFGLVSCQLEGTSAGTRGATTTKTDWVRTVDGWERAGNWEPLVSHRPQLHPLVVGSGQVLAALLSLAAFAGQPNRSLAIGRKS